MAATAQTPVGTWWRTHPEVRFPVRFLGAALLAVAVNVAIDPAQPTLQQATSSVVLWLSGVFDLGAQQHPEWLLSFGRGEFAYIMSPACVGTIIALIYTAGVVAYPATWRQRAIGMAAGIPLLFAVNIIRLVSLGWIGVQSRDAFDVVHVYGWGLFNIAVVAGTWFAWIHWVVHRHDPPPAKPKTKQQSRQRRLSPAVQRAALGVGVFAALLLLGLLADADDHYGQIVMTAGSSIASLFTRVYWDIVVHPSPELTGPFAFQFAFFAAGIALFLATPGVRLRRRTLGVTFIAVPAIVLAHGTEQAIRLAAITPHLDGAIELGPTTLAYGHTGIYGLATAVQAALSIVLWMTWRARSKHHLLSPKAQVCPTPFDQWKHRSCEISSGIDSQI